MESGRADRPTERSGRAEGGREAVASQGLVTIFTTVLLMVFSLALWSVALNTVVEGMFMGTAFADIQAGFDTLYTLAASDENHVLLAQLT
jgi:hypothetical protein